jgi:hypothetical protein
MIVSIMQPAYIPWLGYFDRILKSDIHIVLDDVAMDRSSKTKFTNRNKIRTPNGWSWLTVPLQSVARSDEKVISDLEISSGMSWSEKHWRTIRSNYSRSTYYSRYASYFENFYQQDWIFLATMLQESTSYLLQELGIQTQELKSSELSPQSKKADLILELCIKVGATTYLSGPFGRDYLDEGAFEKAGIELKYHDYVHPSYDQCFDGFEPYMSVVDLLFNHGEKSLEILTS